MRGAPLDTAIDQIVAVTVAAVPEESKKSVTENKKFIVTRTSLALTIFAGVG
ncbi:hypothetical protein [Solimonas soli]|uniref:hypothetical protein n=1 Tax=Solimonas soli TaxID=413479 RepID=UPI0012FBF38D|nr:hypothetical protein [Solimonas soli]